VRSSRVRGKLCRVRGDRVEVVVELGGGETRTYDIIATRAGRRVETTTGRGVVEVTEVTRGGTPVRTGRFMASRVVALVEHPAQESDGARVEVETRRRLSAGPDGRGRRRARDEGRRGADQLALIGDEPAEQPDADEAEDA
jgi:hypothetical protein